MHDEFEDLLRIPLSLSFIVIRAFPSFTNQQLPAESKALHWVLKVRVSMLYVVVSIPRRDFCLSLSGMNQSCLHDRI